MTDFSVGDLVQVTWNETTATRTGLDSNDLTEGEQGVVVEVDSGGDEVDFLVAFPASRNFWWLGSEDVELLVSKELVSEPTTHILEPQPEIRTWDEITSLSRDNRVMISITVTPYDEG